ncbi:hypothetical protein [Streptomyces sp. NPDC127197]
MPLLEVEKPGAQPGPARRAVSSMAWSDKKRSTLSPTAAASGSETWVVAK